MDVILKKYWPVLLCLGILLAGFFLVLDHTLSSTQGKFIYPLDDTYIHINIAKNLSEHGIWGVSEESFSSLSSSLIWPLLISLFFSIFGETVLIPLILSLIMGSALLILFFNILRKNNISKPFSFTALISIIFLTPLIPLIFAGLEHVLHCILIFLFVYYGVTFLSSPSARKKSPMIVYVLAFLGTMARYETLFLVFFLACLFLFKKKWIHSLILLISGFLPVAVYGVISLSQGWYFLPNSVLLKGRTPDFSSIKEALIWFFSPWKEAYNSPHILLLLFISVLIFIYLSLKKHRFFSKPMLLNTLLILGLLSHIQFAKLGWFYRYEAYLIVLGIFTFSFSAREILKTVYREKKETPNRSLRIFELVFISLILLITLGARGVKALAEIPQACQNIYEQQYQMGLFLKQHYPQKNIAVNDIGAVNYLSDCDCLDLWGLSHMDVARAKRNEKYNTEFIDRITEQHHTEIAILYQPWYEIYGGLPPEWEKAGEWKIMNNVVCGGDTVSFYAVEPEEEKKLRQYLKEFSKKLPKGVMYRTEN